MTDSVELLRSTQHRLFWSSLFGLISLLVLRQINLTEQKKPPIRNKGPFSFFDLRCGMLNKDTKKRDPKPHNYRLELPLYASVVAYHCAQTPDNDTGMLSTGGRGRE